ncbi:hypothetical protein [Kangiella profundi]|nr:hypothetical protein [Kangiella profundi]GGF03156.1 hypothetical protein GCM10011356_16120 [Kangiella profundi]
MLNKVKYIFLSLLLFSCVGTPIETKVGSPISQNYVFITNVKQEANVGDTMTSSSPLPLHKQLIVESDIATSAPHRSKNFRVFASSGSYTLVAQDAYGLFFEADGNYVKVDNDYVVGGYYMSKINSNDLSIYWHWKNSLKNSPNGTVYIADISKKPNYKITESISGHNFRGFVSTLTYGGIAKGKIMFVYREFSDGFARDAFTQEVYLDYKPESIYAYKNSRFVVHKADNTMISYTLLKPL